MNINSGNVGVRDHGGGGFSYCFKPCEVREHVKLSVQKHHNGRVRAGEGR